MKLKYINELTYLNILKITEFLLNNHSLFLNLFNKFKKKEIPS